MKNHIKEKVEIWHNEVECWSVITHWIVSNSLLNVIKKSAPNSYGVLT